MNHDRESTRGGMFRSLFYLVLFGSLAIAAFFLISEHRAHIFGGQWTGPVLLAAFIGLHFLMHMGHGGHGGHGRHGGGCGGRHSSDGRRASKEDSDNER